MDIVDRDRWLALVAAAADVHDTSVSFATYQQATARRAQAYSDLEHYRSQGPRGRPDPRNIDMVASHERGVAELQARLDDAERDVARIERLQQQASERRAALSQLIDGVKKWCADQDPPVHLPGESGVSMGGFGATIHVANPPGREPFGMSTPQPAPRHGGIAAVAERPSPRVQPATSGVVRMMQRFL